MQPPVRFLRHHHLHHHCHPHHHIPLVLLCPCSCHRRHHHCHHLPRFASPSPHLPPPCNLILRHIPCSSFSQLLPSRTSPHLVQDQSSMSHIGAERPEAAALTEVADFPASEPQEQEWNENQVPEGEEDVFVLTDEWMEFFAKSEAKRKLAKQQKKKGRR
ncbi:hypothetical protein OPV22_029173 [Ensete ventricosum]|uniref:SKI-interacting protein SKIP SNW domain-containing protein n=1 Tax=Ensete ventricosum TaxID=4639 RepID=A0AAV8P5U5_ENSVE|nr:hypothetical protein OPV22_029173 [Ensete ventricosum]